MKKKKRLTAILTAGLMLSANIPEIWNPLLKTEIVADAVNEDVNINLDVRYESSETLGVATYGIITAYDGQGGLLWEYTTDKYGATELQIVSEIGTKDNAYYFVECGTVVAMDVQTGEVLWKNSDFSGASANFAFGENAIYMCGFYGPDFYAISYSGETLTRIEHLDPDFSSSRYYWPHDIEIIGKYAVIRFEANNDEELYVDLETYEVLKSIDEDVRSGKCGDNAYWSLENGTLTISGTGEMESYLNDRNDNPDATKSPWYKYADEVKKVVIEEGITRTGWGALTDFPNLTEIEFPNSLEVIGRGSFNGCTSLENIVFPKNLESIGRESFNSCNNLKTMTILSDKFGKTGGLNIENWSFGSCEDLDVYFNGTEEEWLKSFNEMANPLLKSARFHSLPEEDFSDSEITSGKAGDNAYWELDENGTLRIYGNGDMYDYIYYLDSGRAPWYKIRDDIKKVVIENGITSIGKFAFAYCSNLTNITIPDSITSIGYSAFSDCYSLESIKLHDGITNIDGNAFGGCLSLISITLPNSVTSINEFTFANCSNLKSITIPNSVTIIDRSAFWRCSSLEDITIPDSVTNIGEQAFDNCSNLKSITMSNNVIDISGRTFFNCSSLERIIIPDSVTNIGEYAFSYCSNLTSITISNSIELIKEKAFTGCENLKDVYFLGTEDEWNKIKIEFGNECLTNANIIFADNDVIIKPLTSDLSYEKMYDEPICIDNGKITYYSYHKIIAKVKNVDSETAENVSVKLNLSDKMYFVDCKETQNIGDIPGNGEVTVEWTVKTDRTDANSPYSKVCKVSAKADNSAESDSQITILFDNVIVSKDNTFDFTKDTWKFTNSPENFSKGYYIDPKYLAEYYKNIPNSVFEKIMQKITAKKTDDDGNIIPDWGGSCYGMSVVAILQKTGVLDIRDYDSDATCLHDAKSPTEDESNEIDSLINAYHFTQYFQVIKDARNEFRKKPINEQLHDLVNAVEKVKNGGVPVVLEVKWYNENAYVNNDDNNKYSTSGHTIVAYDFRKLDESKKFKNSVTGVDQEYSIEVSLYDCSASADKPIYMYITEDYEHWYIDGLCGGYFIQDISKDLNEKRKKENVVYYENEGYIDIINDLRTLDCFDWSDFTKNYNATLTVNNITNLLIEHKNDSYQFRIDQLVGGNYSNDKSITTFFSNTGADSDGVSSANINYVLPSPDGEYKISNPYGGTDDIEYTLMYADSMVYAQASDVKSVTFNVDSVEIDADDSDYKLSMTFNEGHYNTPWYTITASGDGADTVSMKQTENGVIFNSDNMENVKVSANNTYETVELAFTSDTDNVLIKNNGNNLEVYADNDNNGTYETLLSRTGTDDVPEATTAAAPSGSQTGGNGGNSSSGSGSSKDNSPKTGDDINKIYGLLLLSAAVAVAFRKRTFGN